MLRSIALKTIRDRWRSLLWWTLGIFIYMVIVGLFWPLLEQQQEELATLINSFPSEMFGIFGVSDATEMFTPPGYLNSQAFGWVVPVLFAVYAAIIGTQLIAGEEEAKTLDLLLANPVSRTKVMFEKWLGMAGFMLALGLGLLVSSYLTELIFQLGIGFSEYFAVCLQASLLGILFGSAALAIGGFGGKRGLTVGLLAAFAGITFLINSLRGVADWVQSIAYASPFYYYDSNRPLFDGIDWLNVAVLAAVSLIGLGIALWAFPRRDVGT